MFFEWLFGATIFVSSICFLVSVSLSPMKKINIQIFGDRAAISLSMLCVVHCLLFPLVIMLTPALGGTWLNSEDFHLWMLIGVLLSSVSALSLGFLRHEKKAILAWGGAGLTLLLVAFSLEEKIGELVEMILTVLGAITVGIGHYKNFVTCGKNNCQCEQS